jgi:branched-chain amino acid transport system ATP-binding protein
MLELTNIVGGYGNSTVLRDVTLSVPDAGVVALLGPNGAGKSTTLRMASGLLRPISGSIVLDGEDITKLEPHQRTHKGMCHIFEGRGVFPSLSVRENLLMQAPKRMSESDIFDRAVEAFPVLGTRRRQIAGTMSGGEHLLLALARAYVNEPRVVLVDEASLGLAPLVVDGIFAFLEKLVEGGAALLIVEQYVNRALALASHVYLLNQGEIVYSGTSEGLDEATIFAMYSGTTEEAAAG